MRLLAGGIRWRLAASVLTVLAATIAIATAVVGPLYLHAAGDSVLRRSVTSAPIAETGLTLPLYDAQPGAYGRVERAIGDLAAIDARRHFYGSPIVTILNQVGVAGRENASFSFDVTARTDVCAHVRVVVGRCDLGAGDIVLSVRSAHRLGVSVGSRVVALGRRVYLHGPATMTTLRITGLYAIPDVQRPYWWGAGSGEFPYGQPSGNKSVPLLDPGFVSTATALAYHSAQGPAVSAQIPLVTGRVDLAQETALRHVQTRIDAAARGLGIPATSQLDGLLDGVDHQRHQMATIVAVAAVQLVLLAIWVLGSLLVRSAEARQAEARAARLRGFPVSSLLWVTAAEPGLLCLVGAVLGVAVAWVTVTIVRSSLLAAGSSIRFDGWAVLALAATVVAIVGALGIGALRVLRTTRLSPGSATAERGIAAGRIIDIVLVVLAIASLVALATTGALSGHTNPLAAAAPGLIALGAAVIAVQLILLASRFGVAHTGDSPRLAAFLALRQIARRPGLLRQARVLVIALGLACFATAAWSVARSNRAAAADFQVGSRTVVTVAPRSPSSLTQAVTDLDPHGRYAMAAVDIVGPSSALLAVDAPRLTAAAAWPDGISGEALSRIAHRLDPPTAPEVMLPEASVRVSATVHATGATRARLRDVDLDLWVTNWATGTTIVQLGALRDGRFTYTAGTGVLGLGASSCPGGCRLDGIGVASPSGHRPATSGGVSVTITHLQTATGRTLAADLAAGDWRSTTAGVNLDDRAGALRMTVPASAIVGDESATGGVTPPMASVADHPGILPTAASSELEAANASVATGTVPTTGLDGTSINVHPVATVAALPRLGDNATMVDLTLLSRVQVSSVNVDSVDQVWLGPRTPADILRRLRAHGLDPIAVQRATTVLGAMQRSGPALADDFLLLAAAAALLVAAASTLGALGATIRERSTELTSLQIAGVARSSLIRGLALETLILLVTALCGAGAGILAAVLALPSLPERAVASLAPLRYPLPLGVIGIVAAAVLAAVALAATGVAATLLRRMSPTLLRTAPDDISA